MALAQYISSLETAQVTRARRREVLAGKLKSREGLPGYDLNCQEIRDKIARLDKDAASADAEIKRVKAGGKIEFDL